MRQNTNHTLWLHLTNHRESVAYVKMQPPEHHTLLFQNESIRLLVYSGGFCCNSEKKSVGVDLCRSVFTPYDSIDLVEGVIPAGVALACLLCACHQVSMPPSLLKTWYLGAILVSECLSAPMCEGWLFCLFLKPPLWILCCLWIWGRSHPLVMLP